MQTQSSIVQHKRIGELLVEAEILTPEQLPVGLKEAERRSVRLGEVLVTLRYLSSDDLENVLQAQTRLNEGTLRVNQAIGALKYAGAHQTSFEQGLSHVLQEEDDKKAQFELELTVLSQRAEDIERARGPFDRTLAATCMEIADKQAEFGNLEESESHYRRALPILQRALGQRHLKVSRCLSKLGDVLLQQERYKEAESLFWRVLDITQGAWGENHIQVANCHKALATALESQYRLREAEQFYISALRIIEHVLGPDSPEATDLLRHLAAFWPKQGKRPDHKRLGDLLVESSLLSGEQLSGALTYCQDNNCPLGQALVRLNHLTQDDLRRALQAQILVGDGVLPVQLARRALRAERKGKEFQEALRELGWEPDVFTTEELTVLIRAAEELVSAEAALGPEHAGVAVLTMKLADLYTGQKRFNEAEPLYARAVNILEKAFGARDAEVATALTKLANLYLLSARADQAQPLLSRALATRRSVHGEKHVDVAEALDMLGEAYRQAGNPQESEPLHRQALAIRHELLGTASERSQETQQRLADCLFAQQKFEEAEKIYQRLATEKEKQLGPRNIAIAPLLQRLGEIYVSRKEFDRALEQFEQALEIHEKYDRSSLSAAELMEKFAFLLETTGRTEESRKMIERAQEAKRIRSL
ncbi:MAG TPA: tetratricopeptide repeat protein [Candidatus Obscuribacterales bacterium]